jgi:hypothetical protein
VRWGLSKSRLKKDIFLLISRRSWPIRGSGEKRKNKLYQDYQELYIVGAPSRFDLPMQIPAEALAKVRK